MAMSDRDESSGYKTVGVEDSTTVGSQRLHGAHSGAISVTGYAGVSAKRVLFDDKLEWALCTAINAKRQLRLRFNEGYSASGRISPTVFFFM
jgi:hypothetical protein